MELDELKLAWQTLDRRLEQHNTLTLKVFTDGKLDKARSRLRPLVWGQVCQMIFGAVLALMAVVFWSDHRNVWHLFLTGIVLHVYSVLTIMFGGITLGMIGRIDYAAPVLTIQKRLAELRRVYVLNGMVVGMSWWVLWIPFMMMFLMGVYGVDLYAHAPSVIYISAAIGGFGILAMAGLHQWSRDGRHPRLAAFIQDSMTGASLRKAQAVVDEVAHFEKE